MGTGCTLTVVRDGTEKPGSGGGDILVVEGIIGAVTAERSTKRLGGLIVGRMPLAVSSFCQAMSAEQAGLFSFDTSGSWIISRRVFSTALPIDEFALHISIHSAPLTKVFIPAFRRL